MSIRRRGSVSTGTWLTPSRQAKRDRQPRHKDNKNRQPSQVADTACRPRNSLPKNRCLVDEPLVTWTFARTTSTPSLFVRFHFGGTHGEWLSIPVGKGARDNAHDSVRHSARSLTCAWRLFVAQLRRAAKEHESRRR